MCGEALDTSSCASGPTPCASAPQQATSVRPPLGQVRHSNLRSARQADLSFSRFWSSPLRAASASSRRAVDAQRSLSPLPRGGQQQTADDICCSNRTGGAHPAPQPAQGSRRSLQASLRSQAVLQPRPNRNNPCVNKSTAPRYPAYLTGGGARQAAPGAPRRRWGRAWPCCGGAGSTAGAACHTQQQRQLSRGAPAGRHPLDRQASRDVTPGPVLR